MENNFNQMAAYTIGAIFKHIIDCVQLYFTKWLHEYCPLKCQLSLACRHNSNPQLIVQRYQIAAPRWPNGISSTANNAIFKNRMNLNIVHILLLLVKIFHLLAIAFFPQTLQ